MLVYSPYISFLTRHSYVKCATAAVVVKLLFNFLKLKNNLKHFEIQYVPRSNHPPHLGYKNQTVNVVTGNNRSSGNHTKQVTAFFGQNVKLFNVQPGCT